MPVWSAGNLDWLQQVATSMYNYYGSYFDSAGAQLLIQNIFGEGTGRIWLDSVQCTGSERAVINCTASSSGNISCTHEQDAGVRCLSGTCIQYAPT